MMKASSDPRAWRVMLTISHDPGRTWLRAVMILVAAVCDRC